MPLPARFTSLYRITLRATTASVRHNVAATRNIRALYKPEFEEAAKVVKELESQAGPDEAKEKWYAEWEERMYNTVSMLILSANPLNSSVPSRLTRNLSHLRYTLIHRPVKTSIWDPAKPQAAFNKAEMKTTRRDVAWRLTISDGVDRMLDEALDAAEGSARVVLGRVKKGVPGRRVKRPSVAPSAKKRWRGAEEALASFKRNR